MRSPTCQRATIAVHLLLSAAPGCCARLLRRDHYPRQFGGGYLQPISRVQHPRQTGGANCGTQYPVWRGESWHVLGKSLVQPLELCWCQAPPRRLAVFDRALDTVRFGNSNHVRPGRTPIQGHLGQGLVCLGCHLLQNARALMTPKTRGSSQTAVVQRCVGENRDMMLLTIGQQVTFDLTAVEVV